MNQKFFAFHHICASEKINEEGVVEQVELLTCCFDDYTAFGNEYGYRGPQEQYCLEKRTDDIWADTWIGHQYISSIQVDCINETARCQKQGDVSMDFPSVHPNRDGKKCRFVYGGTTLPKGEHAPFNSLIKLDTEKGTSVTWKADTWLGEPMFVPNGDLEGQGWVLVMAYYGCKEECKLLILDAEDIEKGPICDVVLPLQPYAFHGAYSMSDTTH